MPHSFENEGKVRLQFDERRSMLGCRLESVGAVLVRE
jgi:hypothetical protein